MNNEEFLSDVEVRSPNLVVVTADDADERVDVSVQEVLRLLRDVKGVDVVFVADVGESGRHLAYGGPAPDAHGHLASAGDSLEALWGELVLDARAADAPLPTPGRHIQSRVVSPTGQVYGLLCGLSVHEGDAGLRVDQRMLRHAASLTARKIEEGRGGPALTRY